MAYPRQLYVRIPGPMNIQVAFVHVTPSNTSYIVHPKDFVSMSQCTGATDAYIERQSKMATPELVKHARSTVHLCGSPKAEVIDSYPFVTTCYLVGATTLSTIPTL